MDTQPKPDAKAGRVPRPVWWTAAGLVALLLSMAGRYGFHRDELYFVVAGRRLDWGFIDQPPLTPLLARVSETIGGTSPVALRILSALAIGGVVLLAASMARRFGGGPTAQIFAGVTSGGGRGGAGGRAPAEHGHIRLLPLDAGYLATRPIIGRWKSA